MEEIKYTLKDCRAFNQKRLEETKAFIKGNFKNAECKELNLPDNAHPLFILRAVIDQFYKREYEMARDISAANCDMEKAKEMVAGCRIWDELFMKMQVEISRLQEENAQMRQKQQEKEPIGMPKALASLLMIERPKEWARSMDELVDRLIMALDYLESDMLSGDLYHVRTLHKFFIELEKEMN